MYTLIFSGVQRLEPVRLRRARYPTRMRAGMETVTRPRIITIGSGSRPTMASIRSLIHSSRSGSAPSE